MTWLCHNGPLCCSYLVLATISFLSTIDYFHHHFELRNFIIFLGGQLHYSHDSTNNHLGESQKIRYPYPRFKSTSGWQWGTYCTHSSNCSVSTTDVRKAECSDKAKFGDVSDFKCEDGNTGKAGDDSDLKSNDGNDCVIPSDGHDPGQSSKLYVTDSGDEVLDYTLNTLAAVTS
jgi:hypothetical protein